MAMTKPIEEILAPKPEAQPRIYAYSIADEAHMGLLVGRRCRSRLRRDPATTVKDRTMTPRTLTRDGILAELRRLKPELSRRYGVNRIALFGSFAQGEARPGSDIDVVVELAEPDLFALVHIKEELESGFQRPVDVIPYSALMNGFLKARIQREAVYV
jgi:uncharacterized protein